MRPATPEPSLARRLNDAAWTPSLGAWPERVGVRFRVWAPEHPRVDLAWEDARGPRCASLERRDDDTFTGLIDDIGPGTRYRYRLSNELLLPDPASRFQPDGVHGPSEVIDPLAFR